MQKNEEEIQRLKEKEQYNKYQEDLAFAKELNILRNDFYYQMIDDGDILLIDFLYKPLDLLSGDAYTARRIDGHRNFYLIVDGMGKGLSASLTAMTMTTFVNHIIDKMIEYDSFSFEILINESIDYIKPILLEEEAVSIDFLLFNTAFETLSYSKFAMPASLLQDTDNNILKLKSNNPPLSKYQKNFKVDEYNIKNINKFLFCSDGIIENSIKNGSGSYADFIEDDFKNSFTREDLKTNFFNRIDKEEDDITLIFINRFNKEQPSIYERSFETSLEEIDNATEWYSEIFDQITNDQKIAYKAGLVFTELYMNAYEHGNLGITAQVKHKLLDENLYFQTLEKIESSCEKKIDVKVSILTYSSSSYVITQITDEGDGFDTQILSKIFRNSAIFNGRGVFVSRKNSFGIYYNSKGNSVLYLSKL